MSFWVGGEPRWTFELGNGYRDCETAYTHDLPEERLPFVGRSPEELVPLQWRHPRRKGLLG